ncbi:MAG: transposase, partial [Sulfurovaceae bacterium]|nr:transposase [Sulfurovaceae bacterium]
MKIVKTAKLKILTHTTTFDNTIKIYNQALSFYIYVCEREHLNFLDKVSKEKLNYIESITHRTSKNRDIKYDFDKDFYKFPSYLRRAVIMDALGVIDSHFSRLKNWKEKREKALSKGKKFFEKPPKINYKPNSFPTLYRDNMWKKIEDGIAQIKVFQKSDWVWIDIKYSTKSLKSGQNYRFKNFKEFNPMLIKKGKKYFLHISYETEVKLNSTPLKKQKIIGVDLGLTNSAVCSCIDIDGTVLDRVFINQSKEKDQLS